MKVYVRANQDSLLCYLESGKEDSMHYQKSTGNTGSSEPSKIQSCLDRKSSSSKLRHKTWPNGLSAPTIFSFAANTSTVVIETYEVVFSTSQEQNEQQACLVAAPVELLSSSCCWPLSKLLALKEQLRAGEGGACRRTDEFLKTLKL